MRVCPKCGFRDPELKRLLKQAEEYVEKEDSR